MSRPLLVGALLSGAFFALVSAAAAEDTAASPLNAWEGRWTFKSENRETPFGHAGVEIGEGNCAWQSGHTYMVCRWLVDRQVPDEGPKPDNLSIFYYSDVDKTYKRTSLSFEGGPREGVTIINGNTWTATAEIPRRSGGTADLRNSYEFPDKQHVRMKTEISVDKGAHWTEISETALTKMS